MVKKTEADNKKTFSADWLVQGVLTKLGDTFDRLTGRGWNPASGLATSKLTEKLKMLLDSEVKDLGKDGKFVPHIVKLKIQWGKFSTDSEKDIRKLEHELLASAIDHINDKLYHTYAPISIEIQTDYFTEGVRLLGSFGQFSEGDEDEVEVNVTLAGFSTAEQSQNGKISVILNEKEVEKHLSTFVATFIENGKERVTTLDFIANKRISVGRSKENGLDINDGSVSKIHASLVLGPKKELMVADTGSTNGTFVGGQRIAYGKAMPIEENSEIKFGTVSVKIERVGRSGSGQKESNILPTAGSIEIAENNLDIQPAATEVFDSGARESDGLDELLSTDKSSNSNGMDNTILDEIDISQTSEIIENGEPEIDLDGTQDWEV